MSGKWMALLELGLVFGLVMLWGFRELRSLKRDAQRDQDRGRSRSDE